MKAPSTKKAAAPRSTSKPAAASSSSSSPPLVKLPAAMAKRAAGLAKKKQDELAASGRADIAFIRETQVEIVGGFYDIGCALARLAAPGIAEALGYAGFAELVVAEVSISPTKARDLMNIARLVRREDALRWGQEKSAALIELSQATPTADSPATLLKKRKFQVAPGRVLDLAKANAAEIQEAAKAARAAPRPGEKPKRGVTTSSDERALAKRLEGALQALGEGRARVTAVARAGAAADVRIERVALASLSALAKAATAAQKQQKKG